MLDPKLRPTIITVYDAENQSSQGKKLSAIKGLRGRSYPARRPRQKAVIFGDPRARRGAKDDRPAVRHAVCEVEQEHAHPLGAARAGAHISGRLSRNETPGRVNRSLSITP